ncbi:hypothetical protein Bca4012_088560 [Brassica carinata]
MSSLSSAAEGVVVQRIRSGFTKSDLGLWHLEMLEDGCRGVCGAVKLFVGLVFFLWCGIWWCMRLLVELELWGLSSPVRLVSLFCLWCLRCVPVGSSTCGFMDGRGVGLLLRGCGLLCLSLFSNNPFNAVFMSRERVTARPICARIEKFRPFVMPWGEI